MSEDRDPVAIGRDVLLRGAKALEAMRDRLGDGFRRAVDLLERRPGRVVVTGVGKSGSVGAKVAATLTSTGRPASFLHPTEAMHGDLGIVGPDDVVLAISKSGRSVEILDLLPHVKRMGTPVIAMVEDAASPLGSQADVVLDLGRIEEACSLDVVPTTSTTVTMALGDALAVALLRRRGLTREDFAFIHPGGLLGRGAAARVRDLMHSGSALPSVPPEAELRVALAEIVEKGLGMTLVVDARGTLAGILTDGDLKRILLGEEGGMALTRPVARFMSPDPRTIGPDDLAAQAVRIMEERRPGPVTCLVVVEGGRPVGVLHIHDCLRIR